MQRKSETMIQIAMPAAVRKKVFKACQNRGLSFQQVVSRLVTAVNQGRIEINNSSPYYAQIDRKLTPVRLTEGTRSEFKSNCALLDVSMHYAISHLLDRFMSEEATVKIVQSYEEK